MVKNSEGFRFGTYTDSEQKHNKRRKNKVLASKSGWGSKEPEEKEPFEGPAVKQPPSYDVQNIEIADIKVKGKRRALNPDKLKELAESISSMGLQSPITVRAVKRISDGIKPRSNMSWSAVCIAWRP